MKKINYTYVIACCLLTILSLSSCNNNEQKAYEQLNFAESLFKKGELNLAKIALDSIRTLYPKEYKVIRQGNQLMRSIELTEQTRNISYCDSIIQTNSNKIDSLTKGFIFEKDPEYDNIGTWIYKSQTIEKNIDRIYLRATVDEKGNMALASVYRSGSPLKHTAIKVSNADGEYAESIEIQEDGANNYRFEDGGRYNEIVTFKNGKDNGVINFIQTYSNEKITVTLNGKKGYKYVLNKADKEAIIATYNLAATLSEIEAMKHEIKLSQAKIEYLNKKMVESDSISAQKVKK